MAKRVKTAKTAASAAPEGKPKMLTVRCPARSNAVSGRCEKTLDVKWNPETQGFEGNCETHLALRLAPELAESCVKDAAALKANKPK
jgi:hypothetical protein